MKKYPIGIQSFEVIRSLVKNFSFLDGLIEEKYTLYSDCSKAVTFHLKPA